jgi:hypothetical protein
MKVDTAYDEPPREADVCPGCEGSGECSCTRCPRCYEPVYFVDGLRGQERWKHVATGSHVCAPTCKACGQPARHKVLKYGQFSHWECEICSSKVLRIEVTA